MFPPFAAAANRVIKIGMKFILVKKICVFLALVLSLFHLVDAQKTDREKAGLLGAVKTVSSKQINYIDGNLEAAGITKQQDSVTYDKIGNETERIVYDDYGFLVGKEVRTFNASANLIQTVLSDPKNAVLEKQTYSYENNRLIQILSFDDKGSVYLKQLHTYDAKGRLTEEVYYLGDKAAGKTVYQYDAKGNISEVAFYLADGTKAIAPIGPCLSAHKKSYSYNETGKITGVIAYETDGKLKQSWQYTYDSKGNLAEDIRESVYSRKKFLYTYEYDSNANWIKQTAAISDLSKSGDVKPDERKTVILREITYY
jgi:hypothetical protein